MQVVDKLRISALTNAARISPLVNERTLGPSVREAVCKTPSRNELHQPNGSSNEDDRHHKKSPSGDKHENNNTIPNQQSSIIQKSKFKTDVWKNVNVDAEKCERSPSLLLTEYKSIGFRMAINSAEKQRRARILSNVNEQQQSAREELELRLAKVRIDSAEDAQRRILLKQQQREQRLSEAIKQIEETVKVADANSEREISAMIEHNRRTIERANKLKRDEEIRSMYEVLNATKVLFINSFEAFAKTIITNQAMLTVMSRLSEHMSQRDEFLRRYEAIINKINARQISQAEVDEFEKLCVDIKNQQTAIDDAIRCFREAADAAALAAKTEEQAKAVALAAAHSVPPTQTSQSASVVDGSGRIQVTSQPGLTSLRSPERMAVYQELMNFYQAYSSEYQIIISDVNLKKFRFNCQKAINQPGNSVTCQPQILQVDFSQSLAKAFTNHLFCSLKFNRIALIKSRSCWLVGTCPLVTSHSALPTIRLA